MVFSEQKVILKSQIKRVIYMIRVEETWYLFATVVFQK